MHYLYRTNRHKINTNIINKCKFRTLTDLNTEQVPTAFGGYLLLFFFLLGVNLLQHVLEGFEHGSYGDGEQRDAHDAQGAAEDFSRPGKVYLSPLPPKENRDVEHGVGDAAESVSGAFVVLSKDKHRVANTNNGRWNGKCSHL